MKQLFLSALLFTCIFVSCQKETVAPAADNSSAQFKKPQPVSLSISAFFNGPGTTAGSFTSTGYLASSGTTSETVRLTDSTFHGQTTFTDENGSFTAKLNGKHVATSVSTVAGSGNWTIVSGTGDYEKLKGNGALTFTVDFADFSVNDEWTGNMHID